MSSRRAEQTKRSKPVEKMQECGIGRRAGFRCLWSQDRVGSSPISCILFILSKIKKTEAPNTGTSVLFIFLFQKDLAPAPEKRTCKYEKIRNIKYDLLKLRIFHIQAHIIRDVSLSATFRIIIQTAAPGSWKAQAWICVCLFLRKYVYTPRLHRPAP